MDREELLEYVGFFNDLSISEEDVTTDKEKANGQLKVIVTYHFKNNFYKTKELHYKRIDDLDGISHKNEILRYFKEPVYWLDIERHKWPKGSSESDLNNIVVSDMTDDPEAKEFFIKLANNLKNGYVQQITKEGRPSQYHHNLENNNHWHDLINLIKAVIDNKGKQVEDKYFIRLVFKWDGDKNTERKRATLSYDVYNGRRKLVDKLYRNIKSIHVDLRILDIEDILKYKNQIILQGPPGTGKTYTAIKIAEALTKDQEATKNEDGIEEEFYKLIQFHPAYSYEDFVRGIIPENKDGQITYITQNKVLADFAAKALEDSKKPYVLIIDEINRANLPAVLGELIYALEYRGEAVESMYKVEDSRKLVLPENLYIIGTMNTADRSVGHIDYAIRRRFAFVDMLPDPAVLGSAIKKSEVKSEAKRLFDKVEKLFTENVLVPDFRKEDVQVGHSYFIAKTVDELHMKMKYEVVPLLMEYLKDGILLSTATVDGKPIVEFINNLTNEPATT
ncbi:MAG: AAA family ATPase [Cyclobacteriaceae bacterium]